MAWVSRAQHYYDVVGYTMRHSPLKMFAAIMSLVVATEGFVVAVHSVSAIPKQVAMHLMSELNACNSFPDDRLIVRHRRTV